MQRFYLPSLVFNKENLVISDPRVVHQVGKVLRMKEGDAFRLFNGQGEIQVTLMTMKKKQLELQKTEEISNNNEPKLKVSLYQAIPKKLALLELVIQKATEIGVHEIYPLITERTENRRPLRLDRLEAIAMEAAEQSERLYVPTIHSPLQFSEALKNMKHGLMAYARDDQKSFGEIMNVAKKMNECQLLIGPEGGFSADEVSAAKAAGVEAFGMGPRILRTETAAIVGLGGMLLS